MPTLCATRCSIARIVSYLFFLVVYAERLCSIIKKNNYLYHVAARIISKHYN